MATIYSDASGAILRFSRNFLDLPNAAPPGTVTVLDFDESVNGATVTDIAANWAAYSLLTVSGSAQLQKNGAAVSVAAPSALYSLQSAILNGIPDATLEAAIVALWSGTASAAQQQKALACCLLKLHQAGVI